jgi:hypothetical protein
MFILALITNNRVMAATHLLDNDVNKIFRPPEEIDTCVLKSKENIYCRSQKNLFRQCPHLILSLLVDTVSII